jgi:hypothetical protein
MTISISTLGITTFYSIMAYYDYHNGRESAVNRGLDDSTNLG